MPAGLSVPLPGGYRQGVGVEIPDGYIEGLGREYPHPNISHLYKGTFDNPGLPMCRKGWNRDDGQTYSIWRGNRGVKGLCLVCLRRARENRPGKRAKKTMKEKTTYG